MSSVDSFEGISTTMEPGSSYVIPSRGEPRLMSCGRSMETFPEDLLGAIFSHLDSARSLAAVSSTCRRWHKAVMHHLHKVSFIESDFTRQVGHMETGVREIIITKLVMKRSCLQALSITLASNFAFQAAPVIAWLMYTQKTLKSLVFMNRTTLNVNIMEYLGGNLEELRWKFAHIPVVDPDMHCFQSLCSLHLMEPKELTCGNLKALLLVCPKLEHLGLERACILPDVAGDPQQRTLELVSSSLKDLTMTALTGVDNLVLHIECLESLRLRRLTLKLLKFVHGKGSSALESLYIYHTEATQVYIDGAASSLLELEIWGTEDITAEYSKYQKLISGNLRSLTLCSMSETMHSSIDLCKIASSCPLLEGLAIDYENAVDAFASQGSTEFPVLEKMRDLALACHRAHAHEEFAQWVAEFLERCPSLKWLRITVDDMTGIDGVVLGRFTTSMLKVLRQYPHVEVDFDFEDD